MDFFITSTTIAIAITFNVVSDTKLKTQSSNAIKSVLFPNPKGVYAFNKSKVSKFTKMILKSSEIYLLSVENQNL